MRTLHDGAGLHLFRLSTPLCHVICIELLLHSDLVRVWSLIHLDGAVFIEEISPYGFKFFFTPLPDTRHI